MIDNNYPSEVLNQGFDKNDEDFVVEKNVDPVFLV